MKPRLMTPGPTPVPEETLLELARPVTFHRTAEFRATLAEVVEDLKYAFCTKNQVLVQAGANSDGPKRLLDTRVGRPQEGRPPIRAVRHPSDLHGSLESSQNGTVNDQPIDETVLRQPDPQPPMPAARALW